MAITWQQVWDTLAGLEDVKRSQDEQARSRWTVGGRLVARVVDDDTLLVPSGFDEREQLLADHPETFYVTPDVEGHMKVLVDLNRGQLGAVVAALRAARTMQRKA